MQSEDGGDMEWIRDPDGFGFVENTVLAQSAEGRLPVTHGIPEPDPTHGLGVVGGLLGDQQVRIGRPCPSAVSVAQVAGDGSVGEVVDGAVCSAEVASSAKAASGSRVRMRGWGRRVRPWLSRRVGLVKIRRRALRKAKSERNAVSRVCPSPPRGVGYWRAAMMSSRVTSRSAEYSRAQPVRIGSAWRV